MGMEWSIREAKVSDSEQLHHCMDKAYTKYLARLNGGTLPPLEIDYADEIANYPAWVIESQSKIIGGLFMAFEKEFASIANIAVHPDYQGYGLGKELMLFAHTKAKEKGYSELRLATHVLLTENISLYKHLGWVEYDRDDLRVYFKKSI